MSINKNNRQFGNLARHTWGTPGAQNRISWGTLGAHLGHTLGKKLLVAHLGYTWGKYSRGKNDLKHSLSKLNTLRAHLGHKVTWGTLGANTVGANVGQKMT